MLYPCRSLADWLTKNGYHFKDQDKRNRIFQNPKNRHRAVVPQRDLLDEQTITNILRQAGESPETVRKFLESEKKEANAQASDPKKAKSAKARQ
jgi:predicted RNA binding protein YcfA (HicA-like mRNA interferase family)